MTTPMDSDPIEETTSQVGDTDGGDKPSSGKRYDEGVVELSKTIARLQKEVDTLKSGKDRAVDRTEKKVQDLLTKYEELRKQSIDPQSAAQIIERDSRLERVLELADKLETLVSPKADREPASETLDISQVVKKFKLPQDDPRVALFAKEAYASKDEAESAAVDLLVQIASTPKMKKADAPADPKTSVVSGSDQERLMSEFNEAKKGLRGDALIELKMQYRKKGLSIS